MKYYVEKKVSKIYQINHLMKELRMKGLINFLLRKKMV